MLLNVPIKADGTLDKTATDILKDIGKWMDVNQEAIFGTRPWYMYGEGNTHLPHFVVESPFTDKDIRYTTNGDVFYVFVFDSPVELQYLADMNPKFKGYKNVKPLGHEGDICF